MSAAALAAIFVTSFVVSLTHAFSPRPLLTVMMREGVRRMISRCAHQSPPAVCGVCVIALGGWVSVSGIGYAA